mmetsp:Transcript_10810/g.33457  ORF Transcript_10810/g.33457 Transcript_10810/m.33457 type:complete len:225 (+) Transcript_10810:33-707(+)
MALQGHDPAPSRRPIGGLCRHVEIPPDGTLGIAAEFPPAAVHQLGVFLHEDHSTARAYRDVHRHLAALQVELEVATLVPLGVEVALEGDPRDARAVVRPLADVCMLLVLTPLLGCDEPNLLVYRNHILPKLHGGQERGARAAVSVLWSHAVLHTLKETLRQLLVGDQVARRVDATLVELGHACRSHDPRLALFRVHVGDDRRRLLLSHQPDDGRLALGHTMAQP